MVNGRKIMELIRSRGNASAPGMDGLTNPILKMEKEAADSMFS
jgi:hypothetical protein